MSIFKQCCCCINLQIGGIILGVLGVIWSIIGISLSIEGLVNGVEVEEGEMAEYEFQVETTDLPDPHGAEAVAGRAKMFVKIFLWIVLVINILICCASILLIIGAKKSRKEFILPYLITNGVGIFVSMLHILVSGVDNEQPLQGILASLITLMVSGYLWLCVLSLYQWIEETKGELLSSDYR